MKKTVLVLAPAAALAAACATPQNADLDRAEARYESAQRNQALDPATSVDLYEAGKQLEKSRASLGGSDLAQIETSHHAYMAERRIDLAELSAETRALRQESSDLLAERQRLRLEARTTEADRALARARTAEADAMAAEAAAREAELRSAELEQQLSELQARQTERGLLLTLGGVLFEFGKADLKAGAETQLARVAGFLIANPDRQVAIEGHTDDVGGDDYNLELSQARAEAVSDFLALSGVAATRMAARGYGKEHPLASNDTEAGRAENRRVELVILDPGVSAAAALRP